MNQALHPIYEITLTTFTYGGDCLGRLPDGRAVFVPFSLPGERVRIRIVEERRGTLRGEVVEVLEPSVDRIEPRCVHFGVCGGCQYQHMTYDRQLRAKTQILADQLARIGGIQDPPMRPIVPSPLEWYYRNNVQFHLNPEGRLGYQAAASHQVIAIQECHLPAGAINNLWPQLDFEPMPGIERVGLRLGDDEDLMLVFEGPEPNPPEFFVDFPISAVYRSTYGEIVLSGEGGLQVSVLGRPFQVSAGSFFQVNTPQAENMVRHLLDRLPVTPDSTLMDVYCGVGLFSAFFAPRVGQVIGIEFSPSACQDFAVNLDEYENVSLYQGAAEEILPKLEAPVDAVIVDPPRAGLERHALDAIVRLQPERLAYVSCDPATLARDAKRLLVAGYRLTESTPFDLFPQTMHIESISLFEK